MIAERGDGIGIELTGDLLRGVRLDHQSPGVAAAASEVPIGDPSDDRNLLDAFGRLRAELDAVSLPTRIAMFPAGSTMWRADVTGHSGPDLNTARAELDRQHQVGASLLVDQGPRRWLYAVRWGATDIRRVEELAERAGLFDVVIDPSPIALARVCPTPSTFIERVASRSESFSAALEGGFPVAAASIEALGVTPPELVIDDHPMSIEMFDGLIEATDIVAQLVTSRRNADGAAITDLVLGTQMYPSFPLHDLRSPERQCVALGAAIGAAGLAGRIRPVDVAPIVTEERVVERPWALEKISTLPDVAPSAGPTPVQKLTSRFRRKKR